MRTSDISGRLSMHQQSEPVLLLPLCNDGLSFLERCAYFGSSLLRAFGILHTVRASGSQAIPNDVQDPRCFDRSSKCRDVAGISSAVLNHCLTCSFTGLDVGFGGKWSRRVVKNSNKARGNALKVLETRDSRSHSFEIVQPLHSHWDVKREGDTNQCGNNLDPGSPLRLREAGPSQKVKSPANHWLGLHGSFLGDRGEA